jgi:hypothetical protein
MTAKIACDKETLSASDALQGCTDNGFTHHAVFSEERSIFRNTQNDLIQIVMFIITAAYYNLDKGSQI